MSDAGLLNDFLQTGRQEIFIEVEGKEARIRRFIDEYNDRLGEEIDVLTDGICRLGEDVDKWGLEFRLYLNDILNIPNGINPKSNDFGYKQGYSYRINDNDLIEDLLFNYGYRIGLN